MKNNELLPFERNRYFSGKMLTSSDFQAEQLYTNNKRRFINQVVLGSGIICGCGVFSLDDLSLLIESGAAIDGSGREIVIENSVVKKLSAIAGFEELQTNSASLCLRYKEEDVHAVYMVNRGEDEPEYEYNRVTEGYEFFLVDTETINNKIVLENEFFASAVLLDTLEYTIELKMPATVSAGKYVKVVLEITGKAESDGVLDYHATLQTPDFTNEEGAHELELSVDHLTIKEGETLVQEYWLKAQQETVDETTVVLKAGSAKAMIDDVAVNAGNNVSLRIAISDIMPRELALWENNKLSLEMRSMEAAVDYVVLANLKLVRTESAYIIGGVEERTVKKYIPTLAGEKQQQEFQSYFRDDVIGKTLINYAEETAAGSAVREASGGLPRMETGVLEIPLNANAKKGDICYSGEIMHGLGKGNVYVEIGYEKLEDNAVHGANTKSTIYGNPDLFQNGNDQGVCVETAVKVLNDKGSFVVAVRFLKDVDFLLLKFHWVALKFQDGDDFGVAEDYTGKSIVAENPTVVLAKKESFYFDVKFNNMKPTSIAYELTEPGSGEISSDGIYTAPSKEGVYEIRIYCTDMPTICTYAYAIVKNREVEDSGSKESQKG